VKIAVIDSGVNQDHPHITTPMTGGVSVGARDQFDGLDYTDHLGHGTAVMAAIQQKAPDAQYWAIKLFDASLSTRTEYLLNAIEWALARGVDVINLSLGTRRMEFTTAFEAVANKAHELGTILVAPREAHGAACLPGCLPNVLSIGLDWDCPRETFRVENASAAPIFHASGYPRSLPGRPKERNLNGISFAVANMTGFVARARETERARTLGDMRKVLVQAVTQERP
jgi:hypothetical protein